MVCCLVALALMGGGGHQQLPWEVVERRATQRYNRLWDRASRYYGREGEPPPAFIPYRGRSTPDGQPARAYADKGTVYLSGMALGALGGRVGSGRRANIRNLLLHEWAHVFQRPGLSDHSLPHDKRVGEYSAERFAGNVGKQLHRQSFINRAQRLREADKPVPVRLQRRLRKFKRKPLPELNDWLARGQFQQ